MARIGSDGESLPVWLYGSDDEGGCQWYCVDVAEDNMCIQKEVRLARKRELIQLQARDEIDDDDEEVVTINFPPGKLGLRIQPHSISNRPNFGSTCVLGSSVYCSGGFCFDTTPNEDPFSDTPRSPSQDLHCLDTTDMRWRSFRMNTGRFKPHMAAVDGKLYIFGGPLRRGFRFEPSLDNQESEIFDPQTGQTESIPPIPLEFEGCLVFITVLAETKHIVFCSDDYAYMVYYDVKNRKWIVEQDSMFQSKMRIRSDCLSYSVVGTTIYWLSSYGFWVSAYDFANRKFYKSECSIENDVRQHGNLQDLSSMELLHLRDDYFCIVWNDASYFTDPHKKCYLQIRCTKLQISLDEDRECLSHSVLSTLTYLVDGASLIEGTLLANPNMEQTIGRRSGISREGEDNSNARESKCKQLIVSAEDSVTQTSKLRKIVAALDMQTTQTDINWSHFPEKLKAMDYRRTTYKQDKPLENEKEIDELKGEILKLKNFIQEIEKISTEFQEEKSKFKNIIEEITILCNWD